MTPDVINNSVKYKKKCYFAIKDFCVSLTTRRHFLVVVFVTYLVTTYLMVRPLRCFGDWKQLSKLKQELWQKSLQIRALKQQNKGATKRINNLKRITKSRPKPEYENLRRRIYSNTKELWYYINNQLGEATKENLKADRITVILQEIADRKRSLLSDQEKLLELDGYAKWRRDEAALVGDLVQRRLRYLQNPPDCRAARKLICDLNKGKGFGCQMHHVVYCLVIAYATERTLILNSTGWPYSPSGWEALFDPLSQTCTSTYDDAVLNWPVTRSAKVVSVPFVEKISPMPKFLPPVVPQDLMERVVRFNGDASSWWVGQLFKYILKPLPAIQKVIDDAVAKIDFSQPVVGVQVRRTDKYTEAARRDLKEYMVHVADYYDQLELSTSVGQHRVYLATDDPDVLDEARRDYPQYVFYGDRAIAKSAAVNTRVSQQGLTGLLVDLAMLTRCHYLVCTFSSNVGRMAYELMQAHRIDASDKYYSLDDMYFLNQVFALDRIAVVDNDGDRGDISFEAGDQLGVIPGRHKNGYDRGTNKRTLTSGLIPWYKTAEFSMTYAFPVYKNVSINPRRGRRIKSNGFLRPFFS